jgi:DNA-binding CsgD family transcriptional regulator
MKIVASELVERASRDLGYNLADLVALTSVWVEPSVYRLLEPVGGVWYPARRRANLGLRVEGKQVEAVGEVKDGLTLDNNTYANVAFKRALGIHRRDLIGFNICHIWRGTAYDPLCYTQIANLVAIPAELSSLTDHHPHIATCLRYRSWELYAWKPAKELAPVKPAGYPHRWRQPEPASEAAIVAARRRVRSSDGAPPNQSLESKPEFPSGARLRIAAPRQRRIPSGDETHRAALVAAYYLSRFEHRNLGLGNQGQTFDRVAERLQISRNTLKNYRDYFDPVVSEGRRQGWHQVPTPPQFQQIIAEFRNVSEQEVRRRVLESLARS